MPDCQNNKATIQKDLYIIGTGRNNGQSTKMILKPCVDNLGIYFVRTDVDSSKNIVSAAWYYVSNYADGLKISNSNGISVSHVEHLLSAIKASGIDNLRIELDGPEVPDIDGSAECFSSLIKAAGNRYLSQKKEAIFVTRPLVITENNQFALLLPHASQRYSMSVEQADLNIPLQNYSIELDTDDYSRDIAHARCPNLSDGSYVSDVSGHEYVRHQILDAVGDFALAEAPVMAHYFAHNADHGLNQNLIRKLYRDVDYWKMLPIDQSSALSSYHEAYSDPQMIQKVLNSVPLGKTNF